MSDRLLGRLQQNNPKIVFFGLGLLDILMDKCKAALHNQIAGQNFMKQLVAMLNNPNMNPEVSVAA